MKAHPATPTVKRYLSASSAARLLGVSTPTLLVRFADGRLTADAMAGTTILVDADRLEKIRENFHKSPHFIA